MFPSDVAAFLHEARNGASLPVPGFGDTSKRFRVLREQAAENGSVGRLFEAHTDAIAILFEAGAAPPPRLALAVWASGRTTDCSILRRGERVTLQGRRSFCGGASVVDAALVTVDSPDGERLVLVDLRKPGVHVDPDTWKTDAFKDAGIATVHFNDVELESENLIGPPGWYGSRRGFWYGAAGVAAVWAGIGDSLLSWLPHLRRHHDDVSMVSTGSIEAAMWAVSALLDQAGTQIDAQGAADGVQGAKSIALSCRHSVRSLLETAIAAFDSEVGPAAIAFHPELGRVRAELSLSLAQTHGARDLIDLARR
jgi:hypothetical protein